MIDTYKDAVSSLVNRLAKIYLDGGVSRPGLSGLQYPVDIQLSPNELNIIMFALNKHKEAL